MWHKLVGDDRFRSAVSFHHFAQKLQRCLAIAGLCHIGFEDFAFIVDGAPKIVSLGRGRSGRFPAAPRADPGVRC